MLTAGIARIGRNSGLAMVLVLVIAATGGTAARPAPSASSLQPGASSPPKVVFQIHYSGFGTKPSGLVSAGWDDGVVVFADDPEKPGKGLQTGAITREQMEHVLAEVKAAGFFDQHTERGTAPDMSYVLISASVGEHAATHMWNEALTRSYGAHSGVDSPFYRFAKMWAISRTALAFALPKDCVPLAKDAEASKRFERAVGARQIER